MPKLNRQQRIFEHIRRIGFTNLQKQQIVSARYNRKHVAHLNQAQGTDLEEALAKLTESSTEDAFQLLAVKQDALWSESPLFQQPPEYAKV